MTTTTDGAGETSGGVDWLAVRREFPLLAQVQSNGEPLIYFDNAASSQKPEAVLAALDAHYRHDNANVHRGLYELSARATDRYERARARVAAFVGAEAREIVFTRGTTEAVNLVAQSWCAANLNPGDAILLTELEHHSNLVPWQLAAERCGAELRWVPVIGDAAVPEPGAVDRLLSPDVRMFAFGHISNSMGTIAPAAEWCALARERGVTTMVDAAQSVGHIPVDAKAIGCDFLAFSGHKMCGPTGIGALYGRYDRLEALPPWQGGGEMIERVDFAGSRFREPPAKFEAGTPPIAQAVGLAAACDFLDAIGLEKVAARHEELTAQLVAALRAIPGVRVFGPDGARGALCSFLVGDVHPHDLVTYAGDRGLALRGGHHCTQPIMRKLGLSGTARASVAFYNTEAEIDRFSDILDGARRFFA